MVQKILIKIVNFIDQEIEIHNISIIGSEKMGQNCIFREYSNLNSYHVRVCENLN